MQTKSPRNPPSTTKYRYNASRAKHRYAPPRSSGNNVPLSRTPIGVFTFTIIIGFIVSIIFLCIGVFGFYTYYQITDRIVPGVHVGDTDLSGLNVKDAGIELHKKWNLEKTILVTNSLTDVSIPASHLGLTLDALSTAQRAFDVAHDDFFPAEFMQMMVSLNEGWQIKPVIIFDEKIALVGVGELIPQLSKAPSNASLKIEGDQIVPVAGEFGYTVNLDITMETLINDPQAVFERGLLEVTLMPVLPPVMDSSSAALEAQALIDKPQTIRAYDPIADEYIDWSIDRSTLASWLIVDTYEDKPRASFDPAKITAYLNSLSAGLTQGRYVESERYSQQLAAALRNNEVPLVIISHAPTTYIVQPGDTLLKIGWNLGMPFWMILKANPGVDPDNLWIGEELIVPSKDNLLPLPVIPGKRIVLSIKKQHMWIYQNGELIRDFVISTGIDRSPTQPGIFQVQTHQKNAYASIWDLYMPHFLGVYEAWPGFMNGIHGLPTLSGGRRLWANILGRPASYGCIILDLNAAEWLYNWAEDGVVVEITN